MLGIVEQSDKPSPPGLPFWDDEVQSGHDVVQHRGNFMTGANSSRTRGNILAIMHSIRASASEYDEPGPCLCMTDDTDRLETQVK